LTFDANYYNAASFDKYTEGSEVTNILGFTMASSVLSTVSTPTITINTVTMVADALKIISFDV